ncbi:hypothetical protein GNI_027740 [Gregarina niphandrodes]|uniref:Uncharacterized protein n=1 Tax=Gregarina niphandrodes TaxID=110365 RepID=A0A023BBE7_GRENI|nr:hypothetical protein GNI_027740 [Gregarina niphandrodes]EZG79271.1 hypothetical protein GNI_027740 [Gregarina niphandrodes]|eukprot:XP_011129088.1 hypothetical protein GNI_027740 [Gregarina niphandrodes]
MFRKRHLRPNQLDHDQDDQDDLDDRKSRPNGEEYNGGFQKRNTLSPDASINKRRLTERSNPRHDHHESDRLDGYHKSDRLDGHGDDDDYGHDSVLTVEELRALQEFRATGRRGIDTDPNLPKEESVAAKSEQPEVPSGDTAHSRVLETHALDDEDKPLPGGLFSKKIRDNLLERAQLGTDPAAAKSHKVLQAVSIPDDHAGQVWKPILQEVDLDENT